MPDETPEERAERFARIQEEKLELERQKRVRAEQLERERRDRERAAEARRIELAAREEARRRLREEGR